MSHDWSKRIPSSGQDETAALLFENVELRNTVVDLLLETSILREALQLRQTKDARKPSDLFNGRLWPSVRAD